MASFNDPKLSNHIADDVPAIRQLLRSVAAFDPATGNTDIPNGAKRLAETAQGYEFQSYNGTAWVTLEKWNIDAQKMDGYSASTGTTASTVPVRDANGDLPGNILGNAATANEATTLSETLPLAKGGTGATDAAGARNTLNVPPKAHASAYDTYGVSTGGMYGHVRLSDYANADRDVTAGYAATPAAVHKVVIAVETAQTAADAAQSKADAAQSTADAAQTAAYSAQTAAEGAQSTADGKAPKAHASAYTTYGVGTGGMYGHVRLSDYANADRDVTAGYAATPKAVQSTCASVKVPTGFVIAFAGNPDSAPSGYLSCKGSAVSRTTYANLFAVIGETYGAGNGSTTFNLPDLTGRFVQGYDNDFPVGSVKEAGLPNVTGTFHALSGSISGAFSHGDAYSSDDPGDGNVSNANATVTMDLNKANAIYGASATVQPPAVTMRFYIKY